MNKKEAADYLGVSERAIERYTKAGRLSARYEKGKTRPVAVYAEDELRRLKGELEHPATVRPAVEPKPGPAMALERIPTNPEHGWSEFVAVVAGAVEAARHNGRAPGVAVADKLMLSLAEAAQLANVSRNHLRAAIEDKKLKARIIGRGWRVKRDDLDLYVKKL